MSRDLEARAATERTWEASHREFYLLCAVLKTVANMMLKKE
jgi:hypothetical protein